MAHPPRPPPISDPPQQAQASAPQQQHELNRQQQSAASRSEPNASELPSASASASAAAAAAATKATLPAGPSRPSPAVAAVVAAVENGHTPLPKSRESATPAAILIPLSTTTTTTTTSHLHNGVTNGDVASAPTPKPSPMSNPPHQPPSGPPRQQQPVGYPNPNAYPPSAMNPGQYSYVSSNQPGDLYRGVPAGPPNPALSLPSMRSIDPLQQQQQQAPVPMPAALAPGGGHIGFYQMPYQMHPGMPPYPLPMTDPRVALSGGRHKKEIKRRTKTGCLTCRKRRIKCDETHPTCNNCKKSKRECAGYDPIFKQQAPGPSAIQPAPNSQPTSIAATVASAPAVPTPAPSSGSQAAVVPSSYSTSEQPSPTFDPTLASSSPSVKGDFDYGPAIDPALESAQAKSAPPDQSKAYVKGGVPRILFSPTPPPVRYLAASRAVLTHSSAPPKTMRVDELISLGGPPPPPPTVALSRETIDELTKIYYDVYVPGLGMFFETRWYNFTPSGANPVSILLNNKPLLDLLASFLAAVSRITTTEGADMAHAGVIESRVVWALAKLAYTTISSVNPPSDDPIAADNAVEARNRLVVVETLLSGGGLPANPCFRPPKNGDAHRVREFEFWWWTAEYLRLQLPPAGTPETGLSAQRDHALTRMRNLLDGRENRDVIYSMAILRELTPRVPPGWESDIPLVHDETNPRSKITVATQFIKDEALTTGGTTNVVRRFAELALNAFISPGVNIARSHT